MAVMIIAEAGVNHNGSIEIAEKLIDTAKDCGVDAVKFQTFKAENLVTRNAHKAIYQIENTGVAESQFEMLKKLELSYEEFNHLKKYCDKRGLVFLSTPFDFESVDLLKSIDIPIYKVSSGDLTNIPLLKYIALIGKPMIISTGMSVMIEIEEALQAIYEENNRDVTVLHCTTSYPAPFKEVNLNAMITIKNAFNVNVGYSDHTQGIEVSIAAVAMGAKVIEKHFTLDKNLPGPDHKASLEPQELKDMVRCIRNVEDSFGSGVKQITISESSVKGVARKSLIAKSYISKGDIMQPENVDIKRPADGIEPKFFNQVIGRIAKKDIDVDSPIKWEDLT